METDEDEREPTVGTAQIRNLVEFKRYEARLQGACQYDFEKVLLQYASKNVFSYPAFSKIWKESNLNLLFAGQQYGDDIGRFTEICMYTALKLFIFPKDIYTEVGAFYLLYALYYRQPVKAYKNLMKLVNKMRTKKQYDFLYIYGRLRLVKAFYYVATVTPLGISSNEMNLQEITPDTFINRKIDLTERITNLLAENLDDIRQIQSEYVTAVRQCSLQYPDLEISSDLSFMQETEQLENCVKTGGIIHFVHSSDTNTQSVDKRKSELKKRAYQQTNKTYREKLSDKSANYLRLLKSEPLKDDPDN
ncbi:snRNA-activating protein complex subunit 1 isoform X2 [Agrilus planipennis]|uniref:snRNA-activating protein complex subunit 1 isoform X2 n=1 Tax=Agrilus planipennis TaxID=224129 RepID=A0A1W4XL07_AGRPL|nr:snRNA-activating protein complex subunit 1 isoform X2 [Agrilus planipennis]